MESEREYQKLLIVHTNKCRKKCKLADFTLNLTDRKIQNSYKVQHCGWYAYLWRPQTMIPGLANRKKVFRKQSKSPPKIT